MKESLFELSDRVRRYSGTDSTGTEHAAIVRLIRERLMDGGREDLEHCIAVKEFRHQNRNTYTAAIIVLTGDEFNAMLSAIDSAERQASELQAELDLLKAAPVVVLELTDKERDELFPSPDYTRQERESLVEGYNLAAAHARAIGPGEVVVDRALLDQAIRALRCSVPYVGNGLNHEVLHQRTIIDLNVARNAQAKQREA